MRPEQLLKEGKVTQLEKEILDYLFERKELLEGITIQTVAKDNYTSTSTVFRLAKKLGFNGYTEMIYSLAKASQPSSFSQAVNENAALFSSLFQHVFEKNEDQMLACIPILAKQRNVICILGTGYSGIIGEYLYKKLLGKGNFAIFSNGGDTNALFFNNLQRIDSLICISKSGETETIVEKARKAKESGIPIISFTQETKNSLGQLSDIHFLIDDQHRYDWNNIESNQFYPMLLMYLEYFVQRNF